MSLAPCDSSEHEKNLSFTIAACESSSLDHSDSGLLYRRFQVTKMLKAILMYTRPADHLSNDGAICPM